LIKRWVPEDEQLMLWRHTRSIREKRDLDKLNERIGIVSGDKVEGKSLDKEEEGLEIEIE